MFSTADEVLVTIQSQNAENMDLLTKGINDDAMAIPSRMMLGALEATMSRIVDVEDPSLTVPTKNVPVLSILQNIDFNDETHTWTLKYETMRTDTANPLNQYSRVLYSTSKTTPIRAGDLNNNCLSTEGTKQACYDHLNAFYTVSASLDPAFSVDSLELPGNLVTEVIDIPFSQKQEIVITIPHTAIIDLIGQRSSRLHPTKGTQVEHELGIGILFVPKNGIGSNLIMFDSFHLIENSWQMVKFEKRTSYSIAEYVSFWTSRAADTSIYVAHVEFTLDVGHVIDEMFITVNGQEITNQCAQVQEQINTQLQTPTCLTKYPICQDQIITSENLIWVSTVIPVLGDVNKVNIDVLLKTNYTDSSGVTISALSSLNFVTNQPPSEVCRASQIASFDPIAYTEAKVYRGTEILVDTVSSYFEVNTDLLNVSSGAEAVSTIESLLTLVLRPRQTNEAIQYFSRFAEEQIRLDDLFISHAHTEGVLPSEINNKVYGSSGGRSEITLDPNLLAECPREDSPSFKYESGFGNGKECVTTLDWRYSSIKRPFSDSSNTAFVYEVNLLDGGTSTVEWLKWNILGQSTQAGIEAQKIWERTKSRIIPNEEEASYLDVLQTHARAYYIWPVYAWPDLSPIALKDRSLVSLSWSVSHNPSRRLHEVKHLYDKN